MKVIEKEDATASLAKYTTEAARGPVIVTSKGKPIAALVSIKNADLETITLSTNQKFLDLIERSRSRRRAEGGMTGVEVRRRLGARRSSRA